jgi:hypothetical protein
LDRAESLAPNDPLSMGMMLMCRGQAEILAGHWREALTASDGAATIFREQCRGVAWERNFTEMGALRALEELGRVDEAGERAERFLRDAMASGDVYAEVTALLYRALLVQLLHDDPAAARADAQLALERWTPVGYHVQHLYALRVDVLADLYERAPARAWERLEAAWPAIRRSFLLRVPTGRIDFFLMRARVALALFCSTGDGRLRARCAADARTLSQQARPDAAAHAMMLRAGLSDSPAESTALLLDAERAFSQLGMALCAACARARSERQTGSLGALGVRNPARWLDVHAPGFASIE